jgi:hypothetical protein
MYLVGEGSAETMRPSESWLHLPQNGQADVNAQVGTTSCDRPDTDGRDYDAAVSMLLWAECAVGLRWVPPGRTRDTYRGW